MLKEALENLKLDARLAHRRGWICEEEREQALAELPDAAELATTGEDEDAAGGATGDSSA